MKKRILSLALAVLMIASLLPVSASADDTETASGTCGENLTWTFKNGVLTISGTGEMYNYGDWDNYSPWDYMKKQIIDVVIDEGVTQIGSYAFYGCGSIESFSIPSTVTSISYGAFKYCDSLKSITIPDGVTSIERETFSCCESLNSITIPDGVISIGNSAFSYCSALESINIPDSVEYIGTNLFYECNSLKAINVGENNQILSSDRGVLHAVQAQSADCDHQSSKRQAEAYMESDHRRG